MSKNHNLLAAMGEAWEEGGERGLARLALGGDDDLMGWSEADGLGDLADMMGWSEADGLGDLSDLVGDGGDEIGRSVFSKLKRAAGKAGRNLTPAGAIASMAKALQQMRGGGAFPPSLPGQPMDAFKSSIAPGTPARGQRFSWMPFPAGSFAPGTPTTVVLRTTSQRQLRTIRIVADQNRTAAAATLAIQITINEVKIGQEVQPAATGALPFRAFDPLANNIPVNLDPIDVNVPVEVTVVATAAPGAGEAIQFACAFFGYSVK